MNIFRKLWIAHQVRRAIKGEPMEAFKAIFGWVLKSKWASGHRRELSVGLTILTTLLTFASGPLAGVVPALAAPGTHELLLGLASYFGIVGIAFKGDPAPTT